LSGMVNTCESLINVVTENKPKMLTGLDQKVRGPSSDAPNSSDADDAPPAEQRDLTHSVAHEKRGKPVFFRWQVQRKASRKVSRKECG
jgi:hypothetical protein